MKKLALRAWSKRLMKIVWIEKWCAKNKIQVKSKGYNDNPITTHITATDILELQLSTISPEFARDIGSFETIIRKLTNDQQNTKRHESRPHTSKHIRPLDSKQTNHNTRQTKKTKSTKTSRKN